MQDNSERTAGNWLTKLFDRWATKLAALNADIDQTLAESKASREQIDKNMERRRAIFEGRGPSEP